MYIKYFDKFLNMQPYLEIGEEEWANIKTTYDEEDVVESLANVLYTYPLPYKDILKSKMKYSFVKLKGVWWNDIMSEELWECRNVENQKYKLTYEGKSLLISGNYVGNDSSNYFHQKTRWNANSSVSPGPAKTWTSVKYLKSMTRSAYSMNIKKIDKTSVRSMLGVRKYICSQFKPSVAKSIYDFFESKRILDFSAGWGDRLSGFYATLDTEHYVGIDPLEQNCENYYNQIKCYSNMLGWFENSKNVTIINSPAEDVNLSEYVGYFDTIFTSPPYFDAEKYSEDDTQSWKRYKSIDVWMDKFLNKVILNVWDTLNDGGILLINISDIYNRKHHKFLSICNMMNDFISTLSNANYSGCIGMRMSKRPNRNSIISGTLAEPIWCWRKGHCVNDTC